ncbi:hypothetical protein C8D87_1021207 [Lentzea atacamensis]|uniref:Uncharacterized protein n=1 Tax=Lentzea atacamensis TaxID=531938 RepID=A0ABX9EIX2_9PSEU|nr:hypothetical protein [Lentzea atacamensis]RAS69129.1 hypothetical protein C8D87_1021207 [Lentzea atacamensis]
MNDTEQLIKEALGKVAERTPHPGPTLNALRRKRKRHHRNVFLIATAGMAAVAVLIFAGVIASDKYTPPRGNDAAAVLMSGNGQNVALKYVPHWLPDGFVETFRAADNDGTTRVWMLSDATANPLSGDGPRVQLSSGTNHADGPDGWQDATVRGLKARVKEFAGQAVVEWKAQVTLVVRVSGLDGLRETALRVADSVRADSNAVYQAPFKVKDKHANAFHGTSPDDWTAQLSPAPVDVTVFSRAPDLSGKQTAPVTVRGKQGVLLEGREVLVQEGGLWIAAMSTEQGKTVDDLVATVNDVEIAPDLDTGWIRKK